MSEPAKGPELAIQDKPAPKDAQGEIDNTVDLLVDLVTGKKSVRDVARTAFEKAFGGEKKEEPPDKAKLRVVDGGR